LAAKRTCRGQWQGKLLSVEESRLVSHWPIRWMHNCQGHFGIETARLRPYFVFRSFLRELQMPQAASIETHSPSSHACAYFSAGIADHWKHFRREANRDGEGLIDPRVSGALEGTAIVVRFAPLNTMQ
jgi:hypothetical protein